MCKLWDGTAQYFNGRYWAPRPPQKITVSACNVRAAFGAAARIAKKTIFPPRVHIVEYQINLKPRKVIKFKEKTSE